MTRFCSLNPLNPKIQIWILIGCLYTFPIKVVVTSFWCKKLSGLVTNSQDGMFTAVKRYKAFYKLGVIWRGYRRKGEPSIAYEQDRFSFTKYSNVLWSVYDVDQLLKGAGRVISEQKWQPPRRVKIYFVYIYSTGRPHRPPRAGTHLIAVKRKNRVDKDLKP